MNWYKAAEEAAVAVTRADFRDMTWRQKWALARNERITPATQLLFFTQEYEGKRGTLHHLAQNNNIVIKTQRLFFTEEYENKHVVLGKLALRRNITPEIQKLFFTTEYEGKPWALGYLALNTNLAPEIQLLFLAETYVEKSYILLIIAENPSFLRNFTPEQLYNIRKSARGQGKFFILKKRLKQIQEAQ